MVSPMDGQLSGIANRQGGVILRRQALECGYPPQEIKRLLRRHWVRVRHGAYVEAGLVAGASEVDLHRLRVHALLAATTIPSVVSGASAAVLHGLDLWRPNLRRIQVTHAGGSARVEPDVHHHDAEVPEDERTIVDGLTATTAARTVIDVARVSDVEQGLVLADSALRLLRATAAELRSVFDRCSQWPGAAGVARVLAGADGRAQNPAETRTRFALIAEGLGPVTPQVYIYDEYGALVGVVDLALLEHATLVEFDGKMKYGINGRDPRQQLFDEKVRADRLGDLGYELTRPVWATLSTRQRLAQQVRAAMTRAEHRPAPRGTYRLSEVGRAGPVPVGPHLRPARYGTSLPA